ncbi:MAG: Mur ligase family protein [Methanobacteriaceae archaeon]|nr:Mur ligase family protein [Methanobacteriaceae archaeon]
MKCVVIGAGNAGRPVARLLNYMGWDVTITDPKPREKFVEENKVCFKLLENEGIKCELGIDAPDLTKFEHAYISPVIPQNAPIRKQIKEQGLEIITQEYIGTSINNIIKPDIIAVTGSVGKTSTTHIIKTILETAGYNIWICSSVTQNLVSEVIIDGIVKGRHENIDLALLEIPHGTAGIIASHLEIKLGLLVSIYEEHLSEFGGSMEKYIERKSFIMNQSEKYITNIQTAEYLSNKRDDTVYYCLDTQENTLDIDSNKPYGPKYIGHISPQHISINYHDDNKRETLESDFHMRSYYYQNAVAAAAVCLEFGISKENVQKGLEKFKGIQGHLESLGDYNGRHAYIDSAYLEEGIEQTLQYFKEDLDGKLVVVLDNLDTSTSRDKPGVGKLVGKYADIMVATGLIEVTQILNMDSSIQLLYGAKESKALKLAVCDLKEACYLAIKYSKPGDVIVHIGAAAITSYRDVKGKMINGLEEGCKNYE